MRRLKRFIIGFCDLFNSFGHDLKRVFIAEIIKAVVHTLNVVCFRRKINDDFVCACNAYAVVGCINLAVCYNLDHCRIFKVVDILLVVCGSSGKGYSVSLVDSFCVGLGRGVSDDVVYGVFGVRRDSYRHKVVRIADKVFLCICGVFALIGDGCDSVVYVKSALVVLSVVQAAGIAV